MGSKYERNGELVHSLMKFWSKNVFLFIVGFSALTIIGCKSNNDNHRIIAKMDDETLLAEDISVPLNLHGQDSVNWMKNYAEQWLKDKLMMREALSNLSKEDQNIEREVERFRQSLLIHRYENLLTINSSFSEIKPSEIEAYYKNNPEEFILKENIVKVIFVKLKTNDPAAAAYRTLVKSDEQSDRKELSKLASKSAVNSFLDDNIWLYFNDILKEIPIKTYNQEEFLNNNTFIEFKEGDYLYIVRIKGFMIKDSPSPLILVKDNIIQVLISKKKQEFIKDYRNKLLQSAFSEKNVEINL